MRACFRQENMNKSRRVKKAAGELIHHLYLPDKAGH
jgi:hypothetical protein